MQAAQCVRWDRKRVIILDELAIYPKFGKFSHRIRFAKPATTIRKAFWCDEYYGIVSHALALREDWGQTQAALRALNRARRVLQCDEPRASRVKSRSYILVERDQM